MNSTDFNVSFSTTTEEMQTTSENALLMKIYQDHIPIVLFIPKAKVLLYVFGFPANALSCFLWLRSPLRHSSGCYFAALAVSDDLFLLLSVIYELQNNWDTNTLQFPIICEMFPVFYLAVQYLSPLLTLAFTVERYISIRFPLKRRQFCTVRRAKLVILCMTILVFMLSSIQGYFWSFAGTCLIREEAGDLRINWNWVTESTMFIIVPFVILIFNIMVIYTMQNTKKRVKKLYGPIPPRKRSANTRTLLFVSFVLIITTLPVSLTYILSDHFVYPFRCLDLDYDCIQNDSEWQRHLRFHVVREIVYLLGITHYAFNFIIYLTTGKRFRRELKRIFERKIFQCSHNEE